MLLKRNEALSAWLAVAESAKERKESQREAITRHVAEFSEILQRTGSLHSLPQPDPHKPLWGVDGALALTRTLRGAEALLVVVAMPTEGEMCCCIENHELPHTPEAEAALRGRLAMMELLAASEVAAESPEALALLDGSFLSGFVAANQGFSAIAADEALEPLLLDLFPAWKKLLGSHDDFSRMAAVPKLTSGCALSRHCRLTPRISDRWLFSQLLAPGKWIRLREAFAALKIPDDISSFRFRCAFDASAERELNMALAPFLDQLENVVALFPAGARSALLFETTGELRHILEALGAQMSSPRLLEPFLLHAADREAKKLCQLHIQRGDSIDVWRTEGK